MQEANPTAFLGETNKKGRWILRCGLGNEESLLTTFLPAHSTVDATPSPKGCGHAPNNERQVLLKM
ncbi:MAG: hypothetical protein H7A01_12330 [Hahellaceae bacterium]|nr:hypothetical protein [Hahellaceae bacterium]MCP5209894.1 hypothetical protein [Hahellaceae bacterium]